MLGINAADMHVSFITCGKVFVNGPVVHLQGGVAPIPGEAHYVVLPIIHRCARLLDNNVHGANVERHPDFALLLKERKR